MIEISRKIKFFGCAVIINLCLVGCSDTEKANQLSEESAQTPIVQLETDTIYEQNGYQVEVVDFEGIQPLLNQNDDQIHVINFWATWCIPCVAELPYFQKLAQENDQISLTLVSLDFSTKVTSDLLPFLEKKEIKNRVVLLHETDANSWIPKIDPDWSGAIPATIIYNAKKREFYEQSFTFESLETEVRKFEG
jgi:thiol-disulfide isomerase/thioredoxin